MECQHCIDISYVSSIYQESKIMKQKLQSSEMEALGSNGLSFEV